MNGGATYFVICEAGTCNEGDHQVAIIRRSELEEARQEKNDFERRNPGATVTIIFGEEMP